jgi:hypothetical protein
MDETLKRINDLLKKFNSTFEVSANIIKAENGEEIANGIKINGMKSDGSEFIGDMFDMFTAIIETISDEYELVYDINKGLVIAKKQVTVNYVFDEGE